MRAVLAMVLAVESLSCSSAVEWNTPHDLTRAEAERVGLEVSNDPRVRELGQMRTGNLAAVADDAGAEVLVARTVEPDDAPSIYEWTELVVRLDGETRPSLGHPERVTACWRYRYEGSFLRDGPDPVDCPTGPPPTINVPPTLPDDVEERLEQAVGGLPAAAEEAEVRAAVITAFPDVPPDLIDVQTVDGQVGISLTDHADDCLLARRTSAVEVWYSQNPETRGEGACSGYAAAAGDDQTSP